ncbi:MAG: hypothetical protein ACPGXK_13700, partial [Phycisphaerae bacterium]
MNGYQTLSFNRVLSTVMLASCLVFAGHAVAQPVFQSFADGGSSSGTTSVTVSTPSGTQQGDLLIASVVTDGNTTGSLVAPAGQGWNLLQLNAQGSGVTLGVWWKIAGASEPASSQFTWSGGQETYAWIMRFDQVNQSNPIDVFAVGNGNTNSPTTPSVTTTVPNTLIVRIGGFDDDDVSIGSTGLTGHTTVTMDESGSGSGTCSGGAGYVLQPGTGASGTQTFSLTASEQYRTVTLAIAPECSVDGDCDDGISCTTGTCNAGLCSYAPVDSLCDDGNPCNGNETCDALLGCLAGDCTSGTVILNETFDSSAGAFSYLDDTFRGTSNPGFASGNYDASGGQAGGGIRAVQGPAPNSGPDAFNISGGWRSSFDVTGSPTTVRVEFDYRLIFAANHESDEFGEALVSVDGTLQGIAPNDYLIRFTGDGNGGSADDSGWLSHSFDLSLTNGTHQITFGGFNNQTTFDDEDTQTFYDNIRITAIFDAACECDDGLFCNGAETCQGATCTSGPNSCPGQLCDEANDQCVDCFVDGDCDDGNGCTDDTCNAGVCQYANNSNACDDGNACTTGDTCSAGTCVGGAPPNCDDSNVCTDDSCDPASGCVNVDNTAACDDGNACTTNDTCAAGTCVGGAAPNCDDGNACTDDSCDTVLGCINTNNTDPCDDGNACTTSDTCMAGSCVGGAPPNCDDGNGCTDDACDPASGCQNVNNTDSCDDGSACTTNDTCSGGACVGGPAPDCDDGNVCTTDSCDPASGCQNINNTDSCDDGDLCTSGDTCSGGSCAGTPVDCSGLDDACNVGVCNVNNGSCEASPANEGGACDDGLQCTSDDTCSGGMCMGSAIPGCMKCNVDSDCNDGNPCTSDTCPSGVCIFTNNTDPCDDGNACTTSDTCSAGTCVGGPAPNCDDGNACTDDSCDTVAGCVNTNNTDPCDDANACTTGDTCAGGSCVGGPAPDCNDSNVCTDDACDPATGCVNVDNTAACDDGDACTTADTCSSGTCVGGPAPDCDDGNPCTDDTCDPVLGCIYTNNTAACDDGNACTTNDTCSAGVCVGGAAPNCDDSNVCTDDTCDPASGCVNVDNAASCDDGDACTTNDTCAAGVCVGGAAPNCDDSNGCTTDTCDTVLGCLNTNNTDACDDGNACTTNDACSA